MMSKCAFYLAMVFVLMAGMSTGQVTLYENDGEGCAQSLLTLDDIDQDGAADLVFNCGDPSYAFRAVSSRTGQILWQISGLPFSACAVQDWDGDGVRDLLIPSILGFVEFYSGATGEQLGHYRGGDSFGRAMVEADDLTGDSYPEILISIPLFDEDRGKVQLLNLANWDRVGFREGDQVGDLFGASVAILDDIDGDGLRDVAVGAPLSDFRAIDGGQVKILSQADLSVIFSISFDVEHAEFGFSLANGPDVDGDGYRDLVIGSRTEFAQVYSSRTAAFLTAIPEAGGATTGLADAVDFDGDGILDFITFSPSVPGAEASGRVISGGTHEVLLEVPGPLSSPQDGKTITVIDWNNNGQPDLAVGFPGGNHLEIVQACELLAESYGQGCPGTGGLVPDLSAGGCPTPSAALTLSLEQGRGAAPGAILATLAGRADLDAFGCKLLVAPPFVLTPFALSGLEGEAGDGSWNLSVPVPWGPTWAGRLVNLQAFVIDIGGPSGVSSSRGLEVMIQ